MGGSYWRVWKGHVEGTVQEVTEEVDEIHNIQRRAFQRLANDAASPQACVFLLLASTLSLLPLNRHPVQPQWCIREKGETQVPFEGKLLKEEMRACFLKK